MTDNENSQGPACYPLNPKTNPRGHQFGPGRKEDNGYARCRWCDCRENTQLSVQSCPNAIQVDLPDGSTLWEQIQVVKQ